LKNGDVPIAALENADKEAQSGSLVPSWIEWTATFCPW
jgi:hypothetical protein